MKYAEEPELEGGGGSVCEVSVDERKLKIVLGLCSINEAPVAWDEVARKRYVDL